MTEKRAGLRAWLWKLAAWGAAAGLLGMTTGRLALGQASPLTPLAPAGPPLPAVTTPPLVPVPTPTSPPPVTSPPPKRFLPRLSTRTGVSGGKTTATVTVNDTDAATLWANAGGLTPVQRAAVALQRLLTLEQGGLKPDELAAQLAVKPDWMVAARGGPLLMATAEEAAAHHQTPEALAQTWVKTLRALLAEPPITLSAHSLIVPYGETRTVRIGGAALAADLRVSDDSANVTLTQFDPARRLLTVRGHGTGHGAVVIQLAPGLGADAYALPVAVMKYAGLVTPGVTVQVTGAPAAPADLVAQAAYVGLARALSLEDGAQIALLAPPRLVVPLTPGGQTTAAFPLRLTGTDLLPVAARPIVTIINTAIAAQTPSTLFYSNNPEQVKHTQTLFIGPLPPAAATRLDYHHQNMSGQLLVFHVDLTNDTDTPAAVQVVAGLSQPGGDTVQVGRRAGAAFLKSLNGDIGLVLPVPPHGHVPLVTQRFGPGLTVSGLMQLQSLGSVPLTLRVSVGGDTDTLAAPLSRLYTTGAGGSGLLAPSGEAGLAVADNLASPYIFAKPQLSLAGRYVVNGRWAFVSLGSTEALPNASGKIKLFGNYGADYEVTLTLTNPTADARQVGVYFVPGAGPAAAVFQVDGGPILEYDPFSPPDERELEQLTLGPGETRVTHLRTIPLNGSAYPAALVAHALDRRPTPVPIQPAATAPTTPAVPPTTMVIPAAPVPIVTPVRKVGL